jgi:hypothetical protein
MFLSALIYYLVLAIAASAALARSDTSNKKPMTNTIANDNRRFCKKPLLFNPGWELTSQMGHKDREVFDRIYMIYVVRIA